MSRLIDLTGNKYNRLTVIEKDKTRKTNSGSYWICKCDCGNIKSVKSSSLRNGEIQSCGCLRNEAVKKAKDENGLNLVGEKYGYLTVLQKDPIRASDGCVKWICQCDCGKIISVRSGSLRRKDENRTVSCGCYHKSIGEINIQKVLQENNIQFIEQYTFLSLPKSRWDFAIIENEQVIRLIEFDGEQHYKDVPSWGGLDLQKNRDLVKNNYANLHNIPLVRIPYWERDKITLEMILGSTYEI